MISVFNGHRAHGMSSDRADTWRDVAACIGLDGELFFPIGTSGPALLQAEEAKQVCHRCPVVAECLKWATDAKTRQDFGIWGGLDEEERQAYIKEQQAEPAPVRKLVPAAPRTATLLDFCRNNHAYTAANTALQSNGGRRCITCEEAKQQRRRDRRALRAMGVNA